MLPRHLEINKHHFGLLGMGNRQALLTIVRNKNTITPRLEVITDHVRKLPLVVDRKELDHGSFKLRPFGALC